jgi:hypothetical protein
MKKYIEKILSSKDFNSLGKVAVFLVLAFGLAILISKDIGLTTEQTIFVGGIINLLLKKAYNSLV